MGIQTFFLQPTRIKPDDEPQEQIKSAWDLVDGMKKSFDVSEKSLIRISGHVGAQSEGPNTESNAMVATDIWLNGKFVPGFRMNTNITRGRHYEDIAISGHIVVPAGMHTLQVMAYKKHFGGKTWPIYIRAPQYNGLFISVEPYL